MRQSAATLETFYATTLGRVAARLISQRLSDLWGPCSGQAVLGIGYTEPLMSLWQDEARAAIMVTPEHMGTRIYGAERGGASAISPEARFPFADGAFDRIVLLHALEEADHPRAVLREAWRVLAPEGRIVVATANRRSIWSLTDSKAFGHGRPWTRRQLVNFVGDSLFQVTASTSAVHLPPLNWPVITAAAPAWERVGELVAPAIGGVVLVEAVKHLYAKPGGSAAAPVTSAVRSGIRNPGLPRKEAARTQSKNKR